MGKHIQHNYKFRVRVKVQIFNYQMHRTTKSDRALKFLRQVTSNYQFGHIILERENMLDKNKCTRMQ